jgi:hypothetical protein
MGFLSKVNEARKGITKSVGDTLTGGAYSKVWNEATGMYEDVSGKTAEDAAKKAGKKMSTAAVYAADLQAQSAREARSLTERMSQPYRDLGEQNIGAFQNLISNPMGYLENNPMFNAATAQQSEGIKNLQSLSGKSGSGGTVNQLFQNYLAQGNEHINQQYNRLLSPVQMGQNAAAGQATQSAGLITGGANAQAAGHLGAANAQANALMGAANAGAAGTQNLLGLGAMLFSDRRLKENIEVKGRGDRGLPLYTFNYIGEKDKYLGYMADEVQKLDPNEVFLDAETDYLKVSYKYAPVRLS